jgi:hypothetical protein
MAPIPVPIYGCFYSRSKILDVGSFLYVDVNLTTPVTDNLEYPDYYSDGTYCYEVAGGCGEIISKTLCTEA